jgi:hypothetical protein
VSHPVRNDCYFQRSKTKRSVQTSVLSGRVFCWKRYWGARAIVFAYFQITCSIIDKLISDLILLLDRSLRTAIAPSIILIQTITSNYLITSCHATRHARFCIFLLTSCHATRHARFCFFLPNVRDVEVLAHSLRNVQPIFGSRILTDYAVFGPFSRIPIW